MEGPEHIRRAGTPLRLAMLALTLTVAMMLAGCGGSRQDADAPSGKWEVSVLEWKFAKKQPLGTPQNFELKVRNEDSRAIPELILTISGLKTVVYQPGAASDVRPIWLPKDVDYGVVTPYNSPLQMSFNLGPLDPGAIETYTLNLTPLRRGSHEVGYRLSPSLFGDGTIVNADDGSEAAATRTVAIDPTPVFDEKTFKD